MSLPFLTSGISAGSKLNNPAFGGGLGGAVGGWVELGRTTLGGTSDTITVSSLSNKRYYMVLGDAQASSDIANTLRMGYSSIDTGSNYSDRRSVNGASDNALTSRNEIIWGKNDPYNQFGVGYIANYSSKEKLFLGHHIMQGATGASTAPERGEHTGKWVNTSNEIDILQMYNSSSGDYASGSELVVLGWDPADSHTNNFWEELASVDLSGGAADTISSGTITAKKYLWVQAWVEQSSSNIRIASRFNGDTGSNYSFRDSEVGGADSTATSGTYIKHSGSNGCDGCINMFIINNQSNEKLVICHYNAVGNGGAANGPGRHESVGKWANTSNQITNVSLYNDQAGDFGTGTIMKVWGAD